MARTEGGSGRISGFMKGLIAGLLLLAAVLAVLTLVIPQTEEGRDVAGAEEDLDDEAGTESMSDDSLVARTEPEGGGDGSTAEAGGQAATDDAPASDGAGEETVADDMAEEKNPATTEAAGTEAPEGQRVAPEEGAAGAGEAAPEEQAAAEPQAPRMPPPLEGAEPPALSGPALQVNAAEFAGGGEQPPIAVVIADAASGDVGQDVILSLPLAVALGIVPGSDGDQRLAEAARRRTFEVVVELPVVEPGAQTAGALTLDMAPGEIAERTEKLLGRLDEAVAASVTGEVMGDQVLGAVGEALDRHGFGFLGEGSVPVPAAAPTRRAKPEATADEVTALLDEVASEADQDGAVIVLPPTRAALQALADWNAGEGQGRIAPLSAVIRGGSGQ